MVTAQTVEAGNIRAKKKQKKQEILSKIKDFFTFNTQHFFLVCPCIFCCLAGQDAGLSQSPLHSHSHLWTIWNHQLT